LLLQTTIDLLEVFSPAADDVVLDLSPQKNMILGKKRFYRDWWFVLKILTTFAPL
jgi:hypothetical protein